MPPSMSAALVSNATTVVAEAITSTVASALSSTIAAASSPAAATAAAAVAADQAHNILIASTTPATAATMALDPLSHVGDGIFLQTKTAQGIAGAFVWVALFLTCQQVGSLVVVGVWSGKFSCVRCESA